MSKSIVGLITGIESWPAQLIGENVHSGNRITLQKPGTKTAGKGRRESVFVPDITPDRVRQRSLSYDAHLNGWPVYVEDGVLKRAEVE